MAKNIPERSESMQRAISVFGFPSPQLKRVWEQIFNLMFTCITYSQHSQLSGYFMHAGAERENLFIAIAF